MYKIKKIDKDKILKLILRHNFNYRQGRCNPSGASLMNPNSRYCNKWMWTEDWWTQQVGGDSKSPCKATVTAIECHSLGGFIPSPITCCTSSTPSLERATRDAVIKNAAISHRLRYRSHLLNITFIIKCMSWCNHSYKNMQCSTSWSTVEVQTP